MNRTICDVLEAVRNCHKTRNYSYLMGLVEEAQNMANRMEAALWDQDDLESAKKETKLLKAQIKKLKDKKKELEKDMPEGEDVGEPEILWDW